jgi:hypothetical protein
MSFEVFYNFFYNVANGNIKNIVGIVEKSRTLHSQKKNFIFLED